MKRSHQSVRFIQRRRNRSFIIIGLISISIASLVFSSARFISLESLNIDSVNIIGADTVMKNRLEATALGSIQGEYLGLLPKSSVFLYPKMKMIQALRSLDPSIEKVSIEKSSGNGLTISIEEKIASAIVCTSFPDLDDEFGANGDNDTCYYTDRDGYIFRKAPVISGNTLHRYYIPSLSDTVSSTTDHFGSYALPMAEFASLQKFYSNVMAGNIVVKAILVKNGGEYEMYVENPNELVSYEFGEKSNERSIVIVYFNSARSLDDELSNLLSFWGNMIANAKTKKLNALDYVDVRYGANVFYK